MLVCPREYIKVKFMFESNILICMVNKFISFSQGRPNASMQEKEKKGKNTEVTESRRGFWMPRTIRFEARSQWNNLGLDFDLESKRPVLSQPI